MRERQRRRFLLAAGALLTAPLAARAQPAGRIHRIGFLRRTAPEPATFEAFRQGLRELGYSETQNVVVEQRYAHGAAERLPGLAAELIGLNLDVIVVDGPTTALAVKRARTSIPVVFLLGSDPVSDGLVASLARPGGNFTGLTSAAGGYQLAGKRLELLKGAVPNLSRLAVLANPTNAGTAPSLRDAERAARALALEFRAFEAIRPEDLENAYSAITKWSASALTTLGDAMFFSQRQRVVELAARNRLPAMYPEAEFVQAGGLMSYGADQHYLFRRGATYVDKILKGAKPGDLPVEQPTKFELVLNLKTAKKLGLNISRDFLARVDEVIQ
jgi:putative ABC transport system substrate-binding protein